MNTPPPSITRRIPLSDCGAGFWYRWCHWLCVRVYFDRVSVRWPERLPDGGAVLYIGLHRNGAVDGFVYHQIAPGSVFLVSTQLRKSFLGRIFFGGIEVGRKKDGVSAGGNDAALGDCVRLLEQGGELAVFPEGTSSLGPSHLPFKSGAARIALDALSRGVPFKIVPLGIHYERAWAFRSRVEVVVGEGVDTDFPSSLGELGKLNELKRRMSRALEAVGVNFASVHAQTMAERLAFASTLGTGHSYFSSLKGLETGVPGVLANEWPVIPGRRLLRFQDVPLFPGRPWPLYVLLLSLLGPLTLAGVILNLPPLTLGWLAARRFADERNVIALWRILVGLPAGVLWACLMMGLAGWSAGIAGIGVYLALTGAGLKFFRRVLKLSAAVWNGAVHRSLRGNARGFHSEILRHLPGE